MFNLNIQDLSKFDKAWLFSVPKIELIIGYFSQMKRLVIRLFFILVTSVNSVTVDDLSFYIM